MPSKGVLYIATGEEYIKEALRSVRSLKNHSPGLHATLITESEREIGLFDQVERLSDPSNDFGDSVLTAEMLPYDRTLFIDTDTYICDDIGDTFQILDRFDLAAAHNPGSRTREKLDGYSARGVPDLFPQYNTGIIYVKRNERTRSFLEDWNRIYEENKENTKESLNQPSFREALYKSSVNLATLPPEYNFRVRYEGSVGAATGEVKIVHGRHPAGLNKVANKLNRSDEMRVFTLKRWPVQVLDKHPGIPYYIMALLTEDTKDYTYRGRLINSVQNRGARDTVERIIRDLKNIIS